MALGWADVRLWMCLGGKARERSRIVKQIRGTTSREVDNQIEDDLQV